MKRRKIPGPLSRIATEAPTPTLSIVIPVMNEADNISPLLDRISRTIRNRSTEVIFVDDSRDDSSVKAVAKAQLSNKKRRFSVYIIHRVGAKRWGGLSGAVTDGMHAAKSDRVLVMDGDLQHPPETIPSMIKAAKGRDIVVASRYRKGGSAKGLDGSIRHLVSRGSTLLAKVMFPKRLWGITDPMTGFFLFDKTKIDTGLLHPKGFKILLELLATHPSLAKAEVPLQFAERLTGKSHGTMKQGLAFLSQLFALRFRLILRWIDRLPKFITFGAIGGSVFGLGMAMMYVLVEVLHVGELAANAIQLAVTFWLNYLLNRRITWRKRTVSKQAAYKFLTSRALTTVLNYFLFAWLVELQFAFKVLGHSFTFELHYILVNVITLIVIMGLNYVISDRWAFAAAKGDPQSKQPSALSTHTNVSLAIVLLGIFALIVGTAVVMGSAQSISILLAVSSLALFVQSSIEARRMTYSFHHPASSDRLRFPTPRSPAECEQYFCIIVPARHESETLAHTLHLLATQTHPRVDIISVICNDDDETLEVAYGVAATQPRVSVIEYPLLPGTKPSKPLQLNYVLAQTRERPYTVVGVFDAEDTVHPDLLMHIEAAFRDTEIDVVQGGVQLMNHHSSWFSLHNVLEYYRWFNSAMSFNADKQFIPLGGNTVFIRADLLHTASGWPVTLTEDCSLGVLLSTRHRARTAVYYEPLLATREETPSTLKDLFRQRVRWNQGFLHEWRQGIWLELPTFQQRLLAAYVLLSPLLLAIISIFIVVSLGAIVYLKAPVALVMIMYLPLLPAGLLAILNAIFLHDFAKAFDRPVRFRHYVILFLTQGIYQIVLNAAALWSVVRELRGDDTWFKTAHSGLHRDGGADVFGTTPAYAYETVSANDSSGDEDE
jgi:cellulose synthase/poly-beta-1,6-N-acetylglucosamine synthase-like glycosyltransferase/putative flippase GtrA